VPLAAWRPISVSPPDTLRGLAFLAAFSLLFLAVFREMGEGSLAPAPRPDRGRGGASRSPWSPSCRPSPPSRGAIYGLWQPRWDWAVFGPYVNRNHFAGYLVLAAPLAIGFALEALARLRAAWGRRRRGWLLLGEAEGAALARSAAAVMLIVAGLLASQSRGGVSAFAARRAPPAPRLAATAGAPRSAGRRSSSRLGVLWIGVGGVLSAFADRGVRGSRLDLWRDMLPMVPRFPVFGDGWNAFATAFPAYQTVWRTDWIGEAHNDYLQVLLDGGSLGASLVAGLLFVVLRGASPAPRAPRSTSASSARSSASRSTASWTSTGRSRPTPRPGSRSPPSPSRGLPVTPLTPSLDAPRAGP
jgi:hypothetical protein